MATQAAYNANTGKPLYVGETTVKDGITYIGTTPKPVSAPMIVNTDANGKVSAGSSAPVSSSPTPAAYNASNGQPLYVGQTVTFNGVTYTGTTPKPVATPAVSASVATPVATPAVSTPTASTTTLQQGTGTSTAPDASVKAIQAQLGITADGIFGPQTKSAIMAFQQANGLTVDGIVGPKTQAALEKAGTSASSGNSPMVVNLDANGKAITSGQNNSNSTDTTKTGASLGATDPTATINQINTDANSAQDKDVESLINSLGDNVDVSASTKLIESLLNTFNTEKTTTDNAPTLTEQLASKRAELGVDPLETNLNTIDAQIAKLDSDNAALQETDNNRVEGMSQINRRKSADQINYETQKNALTLQRNSVANELNTKYAVINTFMQYASQDYNNAQQNYTTQFTEALNLINLAKGVEDTAKSDAEKAQDNAKANITTIMTALKGKDYSTLDPSTQATITKMESQANLPSGFVKFILENSTNEQTLQTIGSTYTDASGNRVAPVYYKDPSTGVISASLITLGPDGSPANNDKNANLGQDIVTSVTDMKNHMTQNKQRGVDPTVYQHYRQQIFDQYGSAGVTKLDAAIKAAGMAVDYGGNNFIPVETSAVSKENEIDPATGLPNWLVGK